MPRKINKLSKHAIKKVRAREKAFKLFDGGGLFLLVNPNGSRYWRLKYYYKGKEKLLALGVYPEVNLTQAREGRHWARDLLKDGLDPSQVKKEGKQRVSESPEKSRKPDDGKYKAMFEFSKRTILTLENGLISDCNQSAMALFGANFKDQLIGKRLSQLSPELQLKDPNYPKSADQQVDQARQKGAHSFTGTFHKVDGDDFPAQVSINAVKVGDQNLFEVIIQDISEQEIAKIALEGSERLLKQAAHLANTGHYLFDGSKRRTVFVSEQFAEIFGLSVNEILLAYKNSEQEDLLVHPNDRDRVLAAYEQADRDIAGHDIEYRIVRTDGQVRFIRDFGEPSFDQEGQYIHTIGVVQDVTEQLMNQFALEQSEARFKEAEQIGRMGHYQYDEVNRKYLSVSEEFAQIHGYGSEELQEKNPRLMDLVHPDDQARVRQAYLDNCTLVEYRIIHADGGVRHIRETTKYFFEDDADKPYESRGTILDVTEQKLIQQALEESEQLLKHAARMASLGHFVWDDVEDRCIYASEEYTRILGLTLDQVFTQYNTLVKDLELVHPDDRERLSANYEGYYKQAVGFDFEYRIITPKGDERHVREVWDPVVDHQGRVVRTVGILQDITVQKEGAGSAGGNRKSAQAGGPDLQTGSCPLG